MKALVQKYRYPICFIILLCLCYFFPHTGDDWTWGTTVGLDRLEAWFDGYSGRYLGNLFIIAFSRYDIFRVIAMALCATGIIFCIERIIKARWSFTLCSLCLLMTPRLLIRESFVWTSGFANYTTSIFLTLIYIACIYWMFDKKENVPEKKLRQNPLSAFLFLLLGIANTLIVEHLTIYNVILAVFAVGFILFKFKKVLIQNVCYLAGTVAGTWYMFSNSVYHKVADGDDFYRTMARGPLDIVEQALDNYFDVIYENMYLHNVFVNTAIFAVSVLLFISMKDDMKKSSARFAEGCLWINGAYTVWALFSVFALSSSNTPRSFMYVDGIITLIGGFSVIGFAFVAASHYKSLQRVLFVISSILLITGTLFVVTPLSPRCFFAGYVLFVLLFAELCRMLPKEFLKKLRPLRFAKKAAFVFITAALAFYFFLFATINHSENERMADIKTQVANGATVVQVADLPFDDYLWFVAPLDNKFWQTAFKEFYDIPMEVTLVFETKDPLSLTQ